jgi:cytochrome c556
LELRRSLFRVMCRAVEPLIRMIRDGRAFDPAAAETSALRLRQLAPLIREAFERDTRGFQLPTRALDRIWTNRADFNAQANALSADADALAAASRANDVGAAARAIREVFEDCNACHLAYRRDDHKSP